MRSYGFVRIVLGLVCIGHLSVGLAALISGPSAIVLLSTWYGSSFQPTPQFTYILRPVGVYMVALAWLQVWALRDPWRFRPVIDATIAVLALRQLQRVLLSSTAMDIFGIEPGRFWLTTGYFFVLMVLLIAARVRLKPQRG